MVNLMMMQYEQAFTTQDINMHWLMIFWTAYLSSGFVNEEPHLTLETLLTLTKRVVLLDVKPYKNAVLLTGKKYSSL